MAEPITFALGVAVSRAVLKVWVGDADLAVTVASDLSTALERHLPDYFARRSAARQIDGVADQIAKRLDPFFSAEVAGGLPEGDRQAAAIAVAHTLEPSLGDDVLLAHDLDPELLRRTVRDSDAGRAARVGLGDAALAVYERVLRECCSYVVEIASQLPRFELATTQEMLSRQSDLLELVGQVLARLATAEDRVLSQLDREAQWELMYRREVARRLGELQLFGLDLTPSNRRYALESAYITLNVSVTIPGVDDDDDEEAAPQRIRDIDEALSGRRRVLVRGEAGGGKTTLLQWLAVMSAGRRFEGPLREWNDTVPFFLRLRHVEGELPRPEQFLDSIAPSIAGEMPDRFVHAKLASGQAIVLVDGVDELPEERRDDARVWLMDLCANYPQARYVVTSRPPAAGDDWLAEAGVESCLLEPMQPSDIRRFVERWFVAAAVSLPDAADEERAELSALATRLRERIEREAPLRELAGSPLLCAMLCALSRDRGVELPVERAELYRIALAMLLDRRDADRRVPGATALTLAQKQHLLQDLAFWLAFNGHVEVRRVTAVERFERSLPAMVGVDVDADELAQHLLLRSGVLQEPIPGTFVFLHRTFLEYLAALQIVDEDGIGFLLDRAHHDSWREIVLLTAGASRAHQRESLVEGLIERGDDEPEFRHVLHLLAAACARLAPALDPDLRSEVTERLQELIPPATLTDANALATAGEIAVPMLAHEARRSARVDAACVRALGRIGGEEALVQLRAYGSDRRAGVQRELSGAWAAFDRERFAAEVLAETPWKHGALRIDDPDCLPELASLRRLTRAHIDVEGPTTEQLESLRAIGSVEVCALREAQLRDLTFVRGQARLGALTLSDCHELATLDGIAGLPIEQLVIAGAESLRDIAVLAELPRLFELRVLGAPSLDDLGALGRALSLRELTLGASGADGVDWLSRLTQLRDLQLAGHSLRTAAGTSVELPQLTRLHIRDGDIDDLAWLDAPLLGQVSIWQSTPMTGPGRALPSATELILGDGAAESLAGWDCPALRTLYVPRCESLRTLDGVVAGESLRNVELYLCPQLRDIGALRGCAGLQSLELFDTGVESLDPIRGLPIRRLDISYCHGLTDLSPLSELPRLQRLTAHGLEQEVVAAGFGDLLEDYPLAGPRRFPWRGRLEQVGHTPQIG